MNRCQTLDRRLNARAILSVHPRQRRDFAKKRRELEEYCRKRQVAPSVR
jgi:hypothetical protein